MKSKYTTLTEQYQILIEKWRETDPNRPITHIYMTSHFSGCWAQHFNKNSGGLKQFSWAQPAPLSEMVM